MDLPPLSLDALGMKFGTDKASPHHDYLAFYERFFEQHRYRQIKILEIGILEGASLSVWKEYFPKSLVIGADINASTTRFAGPRVIIEILDQSNLEELVQMGMRHGPFDIIIEDGSHQWEHQITTLKTLFPFLRNGGVYIVEDLETNYGAMETRFRGVSSISCVEYLKKLVDLRVADRQVDIEKEEDAFLRTYGRAVRFMAFCRGACLIEKSFEQVNRHAPVGSPLVATDKDARVVPLSLSAHVGLKGEVWGALGWVQCGGDSGNIQGFAISGNDDVTDGIQYRARHSDGIWTEWVRGNNFVGTRGQSRDLSGFSVRLEGKAAEDFEIEAVGAFRGEVANVVVHGGQECVPRTGQGALCGMQVVLRTKRQQ